MKRYYIQLIAKYETEQKELSAEVADLEEKFSTIRQDEEDVALFMERLRKYTDVQELIREMCLELIEYITLDEMQYQQISDALSNYLGCFLDLSAEETMGMEMG